VQISVTEVDRLKADPYAFYARRVLGLRLLDPVDADPSAAWRGNAVHQVLQDWWEGDRCAPGTLRPRAEALLADERTHPMIRALWGPRLLEAIDWIAEEVARRVAEGREILSVEGAGGIDIAGVRLVGRYDRVDRMPGGGLALVDYKTGKAPSVAAVREGYSLQLGMLGVIAERGGFPGLAGRAEVFEYWSLAKSNGRFGSVTTPVDPAGAKEKIVSAEFTTIAAGAFTEVAGMYLTGGDPFTAKLHPEYAPYGDYDQLMRLDEWYGRGAAGE
jgi:ATP-dependent helicase/nuclease subunit B